MSSYGWNLKKLGRQLTGKGLVGRVGHFCVEGRCRPALVQDQIKEKVDVRIITASGKKTEQRSVDVRHAREQERSFHLLTECDLVAIVEGEYADIGATDA